jgi:hypothetical protein
MCISEGAVPRSSRSSDPYDELYAAPIAQFVATRNAIAQRLGKAGAADAARALRATPKPKVTVWALNRTARTDPKLVKTFVAAFDAVKHAQLRQPSKAAGAAQALREASEAVIAKAREAMTGAGARSTLETERRLGTTLRGAAAGARDALLSGSLTDELGAPGFEVFGGAVPAGRRKLRTVRAPLPRGSDTAARDDMLGRRAEQLEAEAASQERAAQRAAAEAREARERQRDLEIRARAATRTAAKSRTVADRARTRAEKRPGQRTR